MTVRHVVWDWNGTLLDDYEITARIAVESLQALGRDGLTLEDIRNNHRRPLSDAFSTLLGREATEAELRFIHDRYNTVYEPVMFELPLAPDAMRAIEIVSQRATQSVLSMAPHEQLTALINHHGIHARFSLVSGSRSAGHHKHEFLLAHCQELGMDPAEVCLIGDTVDDFNAARAVGAHAVMVTTGMQSREHLEETGAPVVASLEQAALAAIGSTGHA